jgi:hypothetical protein
MTNIYICPHITNTRTCPHITHAHVHISQTHAHVHISQTHTHVHISQNFSANINWLTKVCSIAHMLLPSVMSLWAVAIVKVLRQLPVIQLMYCLLCGLMCPVWCDYVGRKGDCQWLHGHYDVRSWATLFSMVTAVASSCQCRNRYVLWFIVCSYEMCSVALRTECKLKLLDSATVLTPSHTTFFNTWRT